MAMETILQTTTATTTASNNKINQNPSQLSSISLMLEYEIDNTLNTIKESSHLLNKMIQEDSIVDSAPGAAAVNSKLLNQNGKLQQSEINNNKNNKDIKDNVDDNDDINCEPSNSNKLSTCAGNGLTAAQPTKTAPITAQPKTNARKRWKILAKVLRKDSSEDSIQDGSSSSSGSSDAADGADDDETIASVRRFKSFDLLRQDSLDDTTEISILSKPENWYTYKIRFDVATAGIVTATAPTQEDDSTVNDYNNDDTEYSVNIHHMERHLTANDLMGFNNTGNICVWPSEEALTVYVLSNLQSFRNKWILELGGGMTCLAGLMLAKYSKAYLVHLTDGNDISMDNVRRTLCLNKLSCYTKCSVLKWEDTKIRLPSDYEKFDWILSADCLFFDDARLSLIDTIWYYLSWQGCALIMAPKRGKTLKIFLDECLKKGLQYQIIQRYNDTIWKRHLELIQAASSLYDEDIHYPILIKLNKIHNK